MSVVANLNALFVKSPRIVGLWMAGQVDVVRPDNLFIRWTLPWIGVHEATLAALHNTVDLRHACFEHCGGIIGTAQVAADLCWRSSRA